MLLRRDTLLSEALCLLDDAEQSVALVVRQSHLLHLLVCLMLASLFVGLTW